MQSKSTPATVAINLTTTQRAELAAALGIDVKFVPETLGVLGVPRGDGARLGLPVDRAGAFSPAMLMM